MDLLMKAYYIFFVHFLFYSPGIFFFYDFSYFFKCPVVSLSSSVSADTLISHFTEKIGAF